MIGWCKRCDKCVQIIQICWEFWGTSKNLKFWSELLTGFVNCVVDKVSISDCKVPDYLSCRSWIERLNSAIVLYRLSDCCITNEGCAVLALALRLNPHLRELDLSWNKLRDSGVTLLFDELKDPHCKLEILK